MLALGLVEARDLEEASFALIENRGEDAWRVELRKATPVDRTVHAHQRDRVQVADDAVGLDRLIGHFDTRLSKSRIECGQGLILDIQAENLNSERSRRRSSVGGRGGLEMRPIIARAAKHSSRSGRSRRRIGPRARSHARGGRIQRSIVRSMARPLYSP
jgi:hypothetical protein